jgi:RNA polymerase sigma factor (sigma-70 family)
MGGVDPARPPFGNHPLVGDWPRLEAITSNMFGQIQKVINRRSDLEVEEVLSGGESARDILQEALIALLCYDPSRLQETWEALSVRIARNKAIDAIRRATKGRRSRESLNDEPDDVSLVSLDVVRADPEDDAEEADPEEAFMRTQQQLVLIRLARELLDERDRKIYFAIHFEERTRAELGRELHLSGAGVGQIYARAARRLHEAARRYPEFPTTANSEGEEDR